MCQTLVYDLANGVSADADSSVVGAVDAAAA